jgi:hypothetical protein
MQMNKNNEMIRTKLKQIFKYLQELNNIRNPVKKDISDQPWSLWLNDLQDYETIELGYIESQNKELQEEDNDQNTSNNYFILKVRRPHLQNCPQPSLELVGWLQNGWQSIDKKVEVISSKNIEENEEIKSLRFEDDNNRVNLLKDWLETRDRWIKDEIPARKAMRVFENLYALQAQIERESERVELLVGDGILSCQSINKEKVFHPVLLQRVQLLFEPSIPEFTIIEAETPIDLYTSLFRNIENINPISVSRCRQDLELSNCSPVGGEETSGYLKRMITQLSAKGLFVTDSKQITEEYELYIQRNPVLFLR